MKQAPQTAGYRIMVEGVLDPVWFDCLGGLEITEQQQPGQPVVTRLEGWLEDRDQVHVIDMGAGNGLVGEELKTRLEDLHTTLEKLNRKAPWLNSDMQPPPRP